MGLEKHGIHPIFQIATEERKSYTSSMNKVLSIFVCIVSLICAAHSEDEKVVLGSLYCGTEYGPGIAYGMTIRKATGNDSVYDIIWTLPWNDKSYVNTGKFKLKELTKDSVIFIRDDFGEYKASIDSNGNFLNGTWRNFKNPERNGPTPGIWELIKVKTSPDCLVVKQNDESPVARRRVIPIPLKQKDSVIEVEPKEVVETYHEHSYKFVPIKKTWYLAKNDASKRGGYLVVLDTAEENKFVSNLIMKAASGGHVRTWIGLNNDNEEHKWGWVNGEKLNYTNWGPGEPNSSEECSAHLGLNEENPDWIGKWNNAPSDCQMYYVVESENTQK
jgi:hypothetical protein